MDDLRSFVDRRIAELSAEIHATVTWWISARPPVRAARGHQGADRRPVATPAAATHNSGLELEAVVQATEAAANRIMEAAEAISDWLRDGSADPASVRRSTRR